MNSPNFLLKNLLLCFFFHFSVAIDTITPNSPVRDDGTVIVSAGKVFALGFFTPGHGISENRYVGIWYNQIPDQTVVWVANRENPIEDKSGVLSFDNRGNLALFEKNQTDLPVWSTNVSVTAGNSGPQLLDSGNFVMFSNDTKRTLLWQSFDYPSNTMLPFMKLGLDRRTGLNRALTSWKSPDNPGIGNYSYRIDPTGFPQLSLYKGSDILWRTGSWTGQKWSGVPEMTRNFIFNVSFVNNEDEVSIVYGVTVASVITRMVVNESGVQQRFTWNAHNKQWIGFWTAPKEQCDFYNHCGPNSNCNPYTVEKFECYCLPGYEPKSPNEWYLRDGSGGCVKKPGGRSMCRAGEGFVKVERVKVPDTSVTRANMSLRLKECGNICLGNCSCVAYANAYDSGIGCLTWHGDLMDTRTYTNDGQDLYVRVDAVVLAQYARKKSPLENKGILAIVVVSGAVLLITVVFFIYCFARKRLKAAGARSRRSNFPSFSHTNSPFLEGSLNSKDINDRDASDLPFFDFSTIASATDDFSLDNKLGEGGFGSVYKGVLPNGKEIAIKRLSKHSGQGVEEFKNEITLIAKLQHRNLVRMLGYCIEKEEKMLIYEYLPNKSLDSFIFDETKRSLLDWGKRFEIICGIARGILYLHQDSRLRIIHRDLKASNVLLDAALNPKISDFGMARMFGGDQIEGSTIRVVGTYGYMSPEYAMHGQFSIKSDVYSFGILLLEIISGRKNSSHYADQDDHISLVGHVWNLWREEKAMEIVDPSLKECYPEDEVSRCIHIALLCVQESATDRPVMSTVVFMLSNAGAALPPPNHPAFVVKRVQNNGDDCEGTGSSVNVVTVTMVQGR